MTSKSKVGEKEIIRLLEEGELKGFITGMDRSKVYLEELVAHIYRGTYNELTEGLCKYSMDENGGFSIFRNNVGRKGICKLCLKKLIKELNP